MRFLSDDNGGVMAKTRKQQEDDEEEPQQGSEESQILEAFSSLPSEAVLDVYRESPDTKRWGWLGRLSTEEFSGGGLELVARKWGAGKFKVAARAKDERGSFVFAGSRTFEIDSAVTEEKKEIGPKGVSIGQVMETGLAQLMQLQLQMMQTQLSNRRDIGDVLEKMAPLLAPVLARLLERPTQKDPIELLAAMTQIQESLHQKDTTTLFDVFKQGMDLAAEMGGGRDSGSAVLAEMGKSVIDLVREAKVKVAEQATSPTPDRPKIMLPEGVPLWTLWVRPHIERLAQLAEAGKDSNLYAEVLVDQLPDPALEVLAQLGEEEDYPENILRHFGEVAAVHPWIRRLLLRVRELLSEGGDGPEDTDAGDSGGGPGDDPDLGRNEEADSEG